MRRRAAASLLCMPDGCSAGRDHVRVPMAAPLLPRSGLVGVQPCTGADMGQLGPGADQLGAGWHPQDASASAVGDSKSQ
jgi:hypothetical protein